MNWPTLTCPFCRGRLPNEKVWPGKPLICPTCSQELQPEDRQLHISGTIALGLTLAGCYLFGLRGLWLVGAVVVLWFPIYIAWEFIFVRIVPPRFEKYQSAEKSTEKYITLHLHD
jgi:hypothetical protein